MPNVLKQQLEQRDTGHRATTHKNIPSAELARRSTREEHDRANRTIARNRQVGQQYVAHRIACVFDSRNDADIELARRHATIEIGWYAVDQFRIETHHTPIDRPID